MKTFITILVFYFSGFAGLLILVTSTFIGITAPIIGIKSSNAMGCLLLPLILFFVLYGGDAKNIRLLA